MNSRLIALVLLLGFGCQTKEIKDITQLREELPKIETPVNFNSDIRVKYKTVELPDNGLIKKINERSIFSLLGKVFETEKTITILGYTFNTIGTPVLITLDNEGNEISSHVVFETAKSEPGHHTTNLVSVLPDRRILFTDSTVIRSVSAAGTEEIPGSDSVVVTYKKYLISETGLVETVE